MKRMKAHDFGGGFLPFTPLFRHSVSSSFHFLFLLLLVSTWLSLRHSKPLLGRPSGVFFNLSFICSIGLTGLSAFLSVFNYLKYWDGQSVEIVSTQVDFLVQFVAWGAIPLFLRYGLLDKRFPILLRAWWLVFFIVSLYNFVLDLVFFEGFHNVGHYVWVDFVCVLVGLILCYVSYFGDTGIEERDEQAHLRQHLLEKKVGGDSVTPYTNSNFLSVLTFSWLDPLLSIGSKKSLDLEDVPQLDNNDSANFVYPEFRDNLVGGSNNEHIGAPKLVKALFLTVRKEVILTAFLAVTYSCASYVGPYLIDSFVQYLNKHEKRAHEGYVLASAFFVAKLVECICQRHWFFRLQIVGVRNKAALTAMIYEKGMSLSTRARHGHSIGEIVNFMSVDAERVGNFSWYIHDLWMTPIQVALALVILYKDLGLASCAALVATIIVMLVNIPLGKLQEDLQEKIMESKDKRMKATSEVLRSIRILKLQAWEMKFLSKIMELRKTETSWLRKYVYTSALIICVFWMSPAFISIVSFGSCMLLGIPLKSGRILSALATFRVLQEPIFNLPDTISMIAQTKVSLDRIAAFLCLEDIQKDAVERIGRDSSSIAIEIQDGVFSWDPSSGISTLKDLNLQVHHGMRVAVCGTVGSGKSSLLACILGEVPKLSGSVRLSGTTAYVSQSPWIQTDKICDNIVFGKKMDRERYERVIDACALRKDLENFPFGDQTVIGERGINMSGGQKQRIQIARALYHDADIYVLDDPFSAVDAQTGTHLFQECLLGFLLSKTVIYVTHQVEFLPAADVVLVMREGKIIQAGKYDSILNSGSDILELVGAHKQALSTINIIETISSTQTSAKDVLHWDGLHGQKSDQLNEKQNSDTSDQDGKLENLNGEKGQLVQEEEREKGRVSFSVYRQYITAAYNGALVPLILLAQCLFQLLQIGSNYWMAWATSASNDLPSPVSGWVLILVYVALCLSSSLCVFARTTLLATAGYKTAIILFDKMHSCIFHAPMSFFDSTPTGRILSRVTTDQSVVDLNMASLLGSTAFSTIQLLGIIAVMSQVAWQVFIVFIPVIAACLWLQQYYITTARELSRLAGVCTAPIIQHFAESVSGTSIIRSFNQESRFTNTNLQLIDVLSRLKFHVAGAMEWLCFRLDLISSFTFAFSLIFLIFLPKGILDPGIAGLAVTYGLNLNMLQAWVIWNLCNLENSIISVERILQYTRIPTEPPLVVETNRPSDNWPSYGKIDICGLQVRYAPHLPLVLRGITCTFHGGVKTGIVGRTGSGKSTIVQALFRILDPTSGRIVIDLVDISTIGLHDLRSRLSIIPQEPILFEGTVRSNLDPLEEYTDEHIWEALDKCQLGEKVRQKEGKLDSIVTENGENWSVGQRQLFCLGRVLLKKSRILVLDEATASVDISTERLIQQTLKQQFSDSTIITIAHRIASVLDSEKVLLLDNGVIVEFDSPIKLLEDGSSAFSRLVAEYTTRSRNGAEKSIISE